MKRILKWSAIGLAGLLLVVALAVFVFPSAIANASRGFAESAFAERFHGTLKLGELELAWSSPQTIRSVEVFDPEGERVLAATIVAPSIRELLDGRKLGRARIDLVADLVADDAGLTNLERALAPRTASEPDSGDTGEPEEPSDWRTTLSELEVEVELAAERVTWSDARTRAAGRPIALANLAATAKLARGAKAELALSAELQDDSPRPLTLQATVSNPFAAPDAADPPSLALAADLRELPTGLVDGLAGLGGTLTRALGPTMTLTAKGSGTATSGALELALDAPRAQVVGDLSLEGGVLRGVGGRALAARIDVDQELIDALVAPSLPPGLAVARPAGAKVEIVLTRLEVGLERLLAELARGAPAAPSALAATALAARVDFGDWDLRDAASGLELGLRGGTLAAELDHAAGPDPSGPSLSPAQLDLSFALAGAARPIALRVDAADLGPLAAGASGARAVAKWSLDAPEVPAALFAELGAPAVEGCSVRAEGEVDAAVPGPAGLDLASLAGSATLRLAATRAKVTEELALGATRLDARVKLAEALDVEVDGSLALDETRASKLALAAHAPDALAKLSAGAIPGATVKLGLSDLPTALADRFTGGAYGLEKRLGASASLDVDASGDLASATAKLELASERATLVADLAIAERRLSLGPGGVRLEAEVDSATVAELLGPALPPGAALERGGEASRVALDVTRLDVPLEAWLPEAPDVPLDLAASLAATDLAAKLALGDWRWSDATLAAASERVDLDALGVALELARGSAKLAVDASLAGEPLRLSADATDVAGLLAATEQRKFAPLEVSLAATRVPIALLEAYAGPLGGRFGESVDLSLRARAEWPAGKRLASRVELALGASSPTRVVADASLADPFAALEQGALPEAEIALDVENPALALSFVPAQFRELAGEALGDEFGLSATNRASAGSRQSFRVALDAPGAKLDVAGVLDGRTFRAVGEDRLTASLPLHARTLAPLLQSYLPAGVTVALVADGEALTIDAREIELPLDAWLAQAGTEPEPLAVALDRARAKLDVALPAISVRTPSAKPGAKPVDATLRGLALAGLELAPGKLVGARLTGAIDATPPGSISLSASGVHPFGFLDDRGGELAPKLVLDGELKQIPTALVDALAAQDGLIVDVLGAGADVVVRGTWPPEGDEALSAELHSPSADVKVRALSEDRVLVARGEQGLDASMILSPLFGERVVGSLVPLIVDVKQAEGSKRAVIAARNFAMPLSGDLRGLNGDVTLDLGAISYRFLPGVAEMFSDGAGAKGASVTTLEPVTVRIEKGVARYERLVIPLGGKKQVFKGSFDLAERAYRLETEIPLSLLGKSVAKSLKDAGDLLDPETKVPIEIRGTSAVPKVRIADGFLKKVLEDAAERALEKKLKDLLGGDEKKKKKE